MAVTETAGVVATSSSMFADKNAFVALTIMIGSMMPAFSIGWIASKAMEAIGRNPEAASRIQTPLVLAVAFTEAIAIYALVVSLIIKFV